MTTKTRPNIGKEARRQQAKGKPPHSVGKSPSHQSPASCFLRPYMTAGTKAMAMPRAKTCRKLKRLQAKVRRRARKRWPHRCACGKAYSREQWLLLPKRGVMEGHRGELDLRNCSCGSTVAVMQDWLIPEKMPALVLADDVVTVTVSV